MAGAEVMPFDLDATTHMFTDTATGGIQDVVANDPSDGANIELIRRHMEEEAAMPGLSTLKERIGDITVELTEPTREQPSHTGPTTPRPSKQSAAGSSRSPVTTETTPSTARPDDPKMFTGFPGTGRIRRTLRPQRCGANDHRISLNLEMRGSALSLDGDR